MVRHIEDYPTMNMDAWDFEHGNVITKTKKRQAKQSRTAIRLEESKHFLSMISIIHTMKINALTGFEDHVGGRSLLWGRHSYCLSDYLLKLMLKTASPLTGPFVIKILRLGILMWRSMLVFQVRIGLPQLPDSEFLKPMELKLQKSTWRH